MYPFIDFTFTKSSVTVLPKKQKRRLLDDITKYCLEKGYVRDSIWTFSGEREARYSSMTRDNFLGFLTEHNGVYRMTLEGAFYYHYYENFYTLAYIDKMWGIMRKEAFPERIEL